MQLSQNSSTFHDFKIYEQMAIETNHLNFKPCIPIKCSLVNYRETINEPSLHAMPLK
uniref:Uncharacterized protein n=1 Tax=Rhizophora mucronata TaxID=61149 RepID=A0A2P2PUC0_RHIMU